MSIRLLRLPTGRFKTVFDQLVFEEKLFRRTNENWCIFSTGKPRPEIVMGMSGKPEKLLNVEHVRERDVEVLKRFSGGGTVVVDDDVLFVSWVCNKDLLPRRISGSPPALMQWSAEFYQEVVDQLPRMDGSVGEFGLQEHDYCLGKHKFAGNAQCLTRGRWVHHTSFLWDFKTENMDLLQLPEKRPEYRNDRTHDDFLCRLKDHIEGDDHEVLELAIVNNIKRHFDAYSVDFDEVEAHLEENQDIERSARRISTKLVEI